MKRFTMILSALALFVSFGNAWAQDHAVKANVPFHFTVSGKTLPSGTYTITSDIASPNVIVIRNGEQHLAIMSTVYTDDQNSKKNVLVFHRYGDQYFLSEILCSSSGMNLELPTTKQDKKVQQQEARLHGNDQNDQILVALK